MNVGFEDEELKPYIEPEADLNDQARIRESSSASSVLYTIPGPTVCMQLHVLFVHSHCEA